MNENENENGKKLYPKLKFILDPFNPSSSVYMLDISIIFSKKIYYSINFYSSLYIYIFYILYFIL